MKKFLLLAAAAILMGYSGAEELQNAQELQLEKEAEAFEKSMTFSDPQAVKAWKKRRELVMANRYEAYQKAVRKHGNQFIDAMNPPECKYYSTEGVCSFLSTLITPYPKIAHVNTDLNLKFPKRLGGIDARSIRVYPTKEFGYDIQYSNDKVDTFANIYIYDMPISMLKPEVVLVEELRRAAGDINKVRSNAVFSDDISRGFFEDSEKTPYFCFFAEYDAKAVPGQNIPARTLSFTLLFSKNQKFIKIRFSKHGGDPKEFVNALRDFMADFKRKVIVDSQIRKRIFEKTVTHPIVLSSEGM